MAKKQTGGSLEGKVTAMMISEFPLDSILTASKTMQDAKQGIVECVKKIKPELIFVDGLFQRMKDVETYRPEVLADISKGGMLSMPMEYATDFLKELHQASPSTAIHYVISDADDENLRTLTAYNAKKDANENKEKRASLKQSIKQLNAEIRDSKKAEDRDTKRNVAKLEKQKVKKEAELEKLANDPKTVLKKPNARTPAWISYQEEAAKQFISAIEKSVPGLKVSIGEIKSLEANGCTFMYAHSYVKSSSVPLKSATGRLIGKINRMQRSNMKLPDFILESGHHAEPVAHPHRHKMEHNYSFVATGLVMEDQAVVKDILDKELSPGAFQGKQGRLEACKRQEKKTPASGIMLVGRDEEGFFAEAYTAEHLAYVGNSSIKLDDMVYETINIVSDSHVGKAATRHDLLAAALQHINEGIDARIAKGLSSPLFFNPNESLQGSNYRTFTVETSKPMTEEVLDSLKAQSAQLMAKGMSKSDLDRWYREEVRKLLDCTNENRIINQVDRYHRLFTEVIVRTLANSKYDVAAVFNEATHIQHTVGEYGISEVGLETIPYKVLDMAIRALEKDGKIIIPEKERENLLAGLYRKIVICESGGNGYGKFSLKLGENTYAVAAEHKPGSAGPETNIPANHVKRINSMEDDSEVIIAGHLHTPYYVVLGRLGTNSSQFIYKGATFSEYDNYGVSGGWSSPVLGYVKAELPTNKGGKGTTKVKFVLSDFLETRLANQKKPQA